MRLEDILTKVYGNGLYQIILTTFGCILTCVNLFDLQLNVLMVYKPTEVICDTTEAIEWMTKDDYMEITKNLTTKTASNLTVNDQCYGAFSKDNKTLFKCGSWNYSKDVVTGNILMEHDLVCEKSPIAEWLNVNYLLSLCTSYLIAMSSDFFGRRPFYLILLTSLLLSNIAILLVQNIWLLFIVMFIRGCSMSLNLVGISQIIELLPINKRGVFTAFYWLGWGLGYTFCPSVAYFLRNWRSVKYISVFMLVAHPALYYLFPESPRWLLIRDRQNEAINILKRISKVNGVKLTDDFLKSMEDNIALICHKDNKDREQSTNIEGFLDGILNFQVFCQVTIISLAMTSLFCSYYGLITVSAFLSDNIYLNVFLQGLVELPSTFMTWRLTNRFGRRISCVCFMFLSGIFISVTPLLNFYTPAKIVAGMLGKICLTCACVITNMYAIEILPTTIRNSGSCFSTMLGTFIASFTPLLNDYISHYMIIGIYGIPLIIVALLVFYYLPETKGYPLPDTIQDCQGFVKGNEATWAMQRQIKFDINCNNEIIIEAE